MGPLINILLTTEYLDTREISDLHSVKPDFNHRPWYDCITLIAYQLAWPVIDSLSAHQYVIRKHKHDMAVKQMYGFGPQCDNDINQLSHTSVETRNKLDPFKNEPMCFQ